MPRENWKRLAPIGLWVIVVCIYVVRMMGTWGDLPQRMVTHWNFQGQPNGWMEKNVMLAFDLGILGFVNSLLIIISVGIGRGWMQDLVNIPNKPYWFENPTRKQEALGRVRQLLAIVGAFANLIFWGSFELIRSTALGEKGFWSDVNNFVVIVLILSSSLIAFSFWRFRKGAD